LNLGDENPPVIHELLKCTSAECGGFHEYRYP
jgi:hypothetical protein